eukprot:CAMPEP_0182423450 /NCGR_PEP_ID=MMETSP1167-20130531/9466_1 /TAXON_ID=2988 /ORGANISM="Mallomonas Sp, Strain CCMP3275" /LENGTH=296 /DNA_ID=CAMNT_0024602457 /DNA_START=212 /DNA_END=1102 /DNA_ORIENTATION=-
MINIGFNKGYNFALWSSLWVPSAKVNVETWYAELKRMGIDDCGICHDCELRINEDPRNRTRKTRAIPETLVMVGVDLNMKNLGIIKSISQRFNVELPTKRNVHIHSVLAAASDRDGKIWIPRCSWGSEVCSIASVEDTSMLSASELRKSYQLVPMVTVDSLVTDLIEKQVLRPYRKTRFKRRSNIRIDVLLIDTEGYDVSVIDGATESLRAGMVRMMVFEYHRAGLWNSTSLEHVVTKLSQLQYDCYFEGQGQLWKLTGCWDAEFEIRRWSNVMCLRRGNIWHKVAERRFRVRDLG